MSLFLVAVFIGCVQSNEDWHFTGLNIARNKVTSQLPGTIWPSVSQHAVDGDRDAYNRKGSCAHTTGALNASASWSVDLCGSYIIKGIQIYNRNTLRERLDNFKIIGFPSKTTLYDDSSVENKLAPQLIINITVNSSLRFSNITIEVPAHEGPPDNGSSLLTLCEVEIYAGKPESSEQSAITPSAVGGITAGTFVIGMAAGIAVTLVIGTWRRRKHKPADTTISRDCLYLTPMEARPEDSPNYEQLNEGAQCK